MAQEAVKKSLDQLPQGLKLHLGKPMFAPTRIWDLENNSGSKGVKFHFNGMKGVMEPIFDSLNLLMMQQKVQFWMETAVIGCPPQKRQWKWYFFLFNSQVAQISFGTKICWAAKGPWGGPLVRGEPNATCELTSKSSPRHATQMLGLLVIEFRVDVYV